MRIWPAIDVRDGKCVRLSQGDFQRAKVYGNNPADMACRWAAEGATGLHIVDLDRAISGRDSNRDAIASIAREVKIDLQLAGGIRDEQTVEDYLTLGISRMVIGTKAITEFDWFANLAQKFPQHLLVTIDCKDGKAFIDGWQKPSDISVMDHAKNMAQLPIAGIIYTDIDSCGMQSGPTVDVLSSLRAEVDVPLIAAGGITTAADISKLVSMEVDGCVIGKSLYEGKLTLPAAMEAATASHVHN